jgi:hypothetical protein
MDNWGVFLDQDEGTLPCCGLHSYRHNNDEMQLYAFDILAMGSDDLRSLPLRKANLAQSVGAGEVG